MLEYIYCHIYISISLFSSAIFKKFSVKEVLILD